VAFIAGKYNRRGEFIKAHIYGPVGFYTYHARAACCGRCQHDGTYCKVDGCGCGKWLLSRLAYKRWLGAFKCPQGHFPYGGFIPALRWLRFWWPVASRLG
jgi:hypothetical protein